MGPSGLVSIDDTEAIEMCQKGIAAEPDGYGSWRWAGVIGQNEDHMVTEAAIQHRKVTGL